jgi:hypothetical protein
LATWIYLATRHFFLLFVVSDQIYLKIEWLQPDSEVVGGISLVVVFKQEQLDEGNDDVLLHSLAPFLDRIFSSDTIETPIYLR